MAPPRPFMVVRFVRLLVMALVLSMSSVVSASAAPVVLTVHGTLEGKARNDNGELIAIPAGTPLVASLTWDSNQKNRCAEQGLPGGFYDLTGFVHFLGYVYTVVGGIESGIHFGNCGFSPGPGIVFRIFVTPFVALTPNAQPVLADGSIYAIGFHSSVLDTLTPQGGLPVLPRESFSIGFFCNCEGPPVNLTPLRFGLFEATPLVLPEPPRFREPRFREPIRKRR